MVAEVTNLSVVNQRVLPLTGNSSDPTSIAPRARQELTAQATVPAPATGNTQAWNWDHLFDQGNAYRIESAFCRLDSQAGGSFTPWAPAIDMMWSAGVVGGGDFSADIVWPGSSNFIGRYAIGTSIYWVNFYRYKGPFDVILPREGELADVEFRQACLATNGSQVVVTLYLRILEYQFQQGYHAGMYGPLPVT